MFSACAELKLYYLAEWPLEHSKQMEDNVTGEGTRILTRRLEEHEVVSFVVREVPENQRFEQRYFKDPTGAYYNQVLHRLQEHLDRLRAEKLENRPPVVNQQKPIEEVNTKYRNKVNEKRQKIAALIEGSVSPKLTHIANRLHCSFELVKKVYNEMRVLGEVQRFQYQNMHTEEEEADLADALEGCHISYTTVTDIKRANPTYSRKKILERLHQRRLKWTELRGVPNIKKKRTMRDPPNPRKMRHIVRTITCALQDPTTEVFYVDEMKFPLHQTPRHHWADPNLPDQLAWGQRLSRTTLTAIAICSIRRFEAVQLYKEEPELYDLLAKAYADQGKMTLQHMALAESYVLQGATMAALDQLTIARKSTDATFYDQAVIDARERELQEKRREQLKDQKS